MNKRHLIATILVIYFLQWPVFVFSREEVSSSTQTTESPQQLAKLFGRSQIDSENVEEEYQKALRFYNKDRMDKAKEAFLRIDKIFPDYKDTRRYLKIINQKFEHELRMREDSAYRQQALDGELKKEAWREGLDAKLEDEKAGNEREAEAAYQQARVLYDRGQFAQAKERFEFVDKTVPNYRQTVRFLKSIEQKMAASAMAVVSPDVSAAYIVPDEEETVSELPPAPGIKILEDSERPCVDAAKNVVFLEPLQIDFSNAETVALDPMSYEEIFCAKDNGPDKVQKMAALAKKDKEIKAESLYAQAMDLYSNKMYDEAEQLFSQVQFIIPGYKSTESYLKKVSKARQRDEADRLEEQAKSFAQQLRAQRQDEKTKSEDKTVIRQLELDDLYRVAKEEYDRGEFASAKMKFFQISEAQPGFKATDWYLKKIQAKEGFNDEALPSKQMTVTGFGGQRLSVPVPVRKDLVDNPDIQNAIKRRREQMGAFTEQKYAQAMDFYKDQNFMEARNKFIQVEAMSPNYKETRKYLSRLEQDLAQPSASATSNVQDDRIVLEPVAKESVKKVAPPVQPPSSEGKKPSFWDKLVGKKQAEPQKPEAKVDVKKPVVEQAMSKPVVPDVKVKAVVAVDPKVQELYRQAVAAYDNKDYMAAEEKFKNIQEAVAGYERTDFYLKDLKKIADRREKERQRIARKMAEANQRAEKAMAKQEAQRKAQEAKEAKAKQEAEEREKLAAKLLEEKQQREAKALEEQKQREAKALEEQKQREARLEEDRRMRELKLKAQEEARAAKAREQMALLKVQAEEQRRKKEAELAQQKAKIEAEVAKPVEANVKVEASTGTAEATLAKDLKKDSSKDSKTSLFGWLKGKDKKEKVEKAEADGSVRLDVAKQPAPKVDEAALEKAYQEGIKAYDEGRYLSALDQFQAIQAVRKNYKNTADFLKKSEKMVASREKDRLKEAKILARESKNVPEAEPAQEKPKPQTNIQSSVSPEVVSVPEPEKKSVLGRLKFWGKSEPSAAALGQPSKEAPAQTPTSEELAKNQKDVEKMREKISKRDQEDAERVAKLERRHRRETFKIEQDQPSGAVKDVVKNAPADTGSVVNVELPREKREAMMEKRRKDLEKIVQERRKALQIQRTKIQKEYEKSLEDLYQKALTMEKAGLNQQAYRMFMDISNLEPGYKDIQKHISRLSAQPKPVEINAGLETRVVEPSRSDLISAALDQAEKGM